MKARQTPLLLCIALACSASQEATRVELPVVLDASKLAASTSDLGWTVELTAARLAVTDIQFTIQGEMHASGATAWVPRGILSRAWAHPGHEAGGDVTGELAGSFVLDWSGHAGMSLGTAEMLVGDYNGMNFTFRAADASDGLADDDPLLGHAAHFAGTASKDGVTITFTALLVSNTRMIGAPFELEITDATRDTLGIQLLPTDPVESRSLFDGLDFAALDDDGDGVVEIVPGDEAHSTFRRTLQSHVHYDAVPR
jgi:hypothetical protein